MVIRMDLDCTSEGLLGVKFGGWGGSAEVVVGRQLLRKPGCFWLGEFQIQNIRGAMHSASSWKEWVLHTYSLYLALTLIGVCALGEAA